jgi:hypothetical protein
MPQRDDEPITEQDFADDPVDGDGVITIPPIDRIEKMPMDLPEATGQLLLTESVGNIQNTNVNARNIANIAMGALQAGVARVHNELGTEESRAISGVMATPIAPPATGGA